MMYDLTRLRYDLTRLMTRRMFSSGGGVNNAMPGLTQVLHVNNPQKNPLRMRVRVSYTINGSPVLETSEINNFPANTW